MEDRPGIVYCGITVNLPLLPIEQIQQTVALQRCHLDNDYENGLRNLWKANADIVVVEHDIAAQPCHVAELLACPSVLCAFAYVLYPNSTGLREPVIAHRNDGEWIEEDAQWAAQASLGLTKFGRIARMAVPSWQRTDADGWRNLDIRISDAMNRSGLKFHIHWPMVEHRHSIERIICE